MGGKVHFCVHKMGLGVKLTSLLSSRETLLPCDHNATELGSGLCLVTLLQWFGFMAMNWVLAMGWVWGHGLSFEDLCSLKFHSPAPNPPICDLFMLHLFYFHHH